MFLGKNVVWVQILVSWTLLSSVVALENVHPITEGIPLKPEEKTIEKKLADARNDDPLLNYYVKMAEYGMKELEKHKIIDQLDLIGFTDALKKSDESRASDELQLILSFGSKKTQKVKAKYEVHFHRNAQAYAEGVAIVNAWELDQFTAKRKRKLELPLPRPPPSQKLLLGVIATGVCLLLVGIALLCFSSGSEKKNNDKTD